MRTERIAWIVGCVGLVVSVLGAILRPDAFAFAWLSALMIWLRWPLGCLALLLVHALTGGRWGITIRPSLVLGIGVLPLLLPAIVPVLVLLPHLYPWARPDAHPVNGFYLNLPFAAARWVFYLVVWFGVGAVTLLRLRRDAPIGTIAAPGLILLGLTANFAAIDALMSLDPQFNSSDFGMTFAAESALFALSISILATLVSGPVAPSERNDLGQLLQSMLVLWAYLDFMQLLIVWQSNLPKEAALVHRALRRHVGRRGGDHRGRAFPAALPGLADTRVAPIQNRNDCHHQPVDRHVHHPGLVAGAAGAATRRRLDRHCGRTGVRRHLHRPDVARPQSALAHDPCLNPRFLLPVTRRQTSDRDPP